MIKTWLKLSIFSVSDDAAHVVASTFGAFLLIFVSNIDVFSAFMDRNFQKSGFAAHFWQRIHPWSLVPSRFLMIRGRLFLFPQSSAV
jgi:hypothetical protein